jgi:CRISPR-associated endonuclease Csn1
VKAVSESILISHYTPSVLSKHTKKALRVRGKLQYGENGKKLYVQGDTARCSLHEQTFYGAIKKDDEIKYVVRKTLDSLEPKDVDKIVDDVVREKVRSAIAAKGFKKAMSEIIWMNEKLRIPIKKVRIYVPTLTNPIKLKEHRDKSVHEHKRSVNVKNDGNYCMAIYEGNNDRGKVVRSYKLVNNLDAVNYFNGKTSLDNLVPQSDDKDLPLKCILKTGTMVLFYEKSPKELYDCGAEELSKRLYKVTGMSVSTITQGDKKYTYGMATFRHHLEARKSNELPVKKGEWKAGEAYRPVIELSHKQFNAFVENHDFVIKSSGQIKYK